MLKQFSLSLSAKSFKKANSQLTKMKFLILLQGVYSKQGHEVNINFAVYIIQLESTNNYSDKGVMQRSSWL